MKQSHRADMLRHSQPRASPSPESTGRTDNLDDADENSSISLAQSGCHSILTAWRIKSANRAARSRHRPLSVLSNGSSTGKKSAASTVFTLRGKSPASQSRIALGPRAAQHFVTNSRRRRQANELILTTLEARRQALALNRQNASLFGSASYLASEHNPLLAPDGADELSGRLSLSPSPAKSPSRHTPSPAPRQRPTLSDLGGRSSAAAQAQRQRLLLNSAKPKTTSAAAPLVKIDQNSSDLYSSNSSSSSDSSQFTQLVTSELAPDCALLEQQAPRQSPQHNIVTRLVSVPSHTQRPQVRPKPRATTAPQPPKRAEPPPKVPERARAKQQTTRNDDDDESDQVSNLRRGALRRDSIRRIRLSRAPPKESFSSDVAPSSSDSSGSCKAPPEPQQLPKARKLDIESNPFLNRGHFRSSVNSVRSQLSREDSTGERVAKEQTREAKRNSWLFGHAAGRRAESAVRATDSERATEAPRPRSFSEARRSNSSESIREPGNKVGKQQQRQQEEEQIKQVESMLRSMRPNQVFTSYARESESIKSKSMTSTTITASAEPQTTTTMQEYWRREKSAEEERLERLEMMRSTSISPPAAFADTQHRSPPPAPAARQQKPVVQTSVAKDVPKFERTADDEFKKRVDYLRKLARSNLSETSAVSQERRRPVYTTKPMSTNWRREEQASESPAVRQQPVGQIKKSESAKPPVARRSSPQLATTTNLDALLIADRYQAPTSSASRELAPSSNFAWRRSNSSLASVGTARSPLSPTEQREPLTARSASLRTSQLAAPPVAQQQPREQTTAVKLVVREKSAPKLDYAVVEQQPMVQHARPSTIEDRRRLQQAATPRPVSQQQLAPKQAVRSQTRSPLRVVSPRSPDFGLTAASSNDDSAIASSVSSPSLSFMVNPSSSEQTRRSAPPSGQHSGALQSILRRQQLQQQQQQQSSDSSDGSTQVGSVKRGLGAQVPQEPLFRSDARSPEPSRPMSPSRDQADPIQSTQQQPTPPKRVHFNDRTSIRSFESVSSLASNSTAVPNEMLRQQVGSPDSMGSGSTSRLSAESPDESRRGAAIYAVRGDPELEMQQMQQSRQQQIPYNLQQHAPPLVRYAAPASYQPNVSPYVRMNAPASITTPVAQPQVQYIRTKPPSYQLADEDDDPDYAIRLRQAATSRAMFNYVPTAPPAQLRQPFQQSPQQRVVHSNDLANFQTEV